jgi:hypothetical protein
MERFFACQLRDSFCQRQMDSYLFVFSFGQSKGKVDKFPCVLNMLDVLRESLILVSGGFHLLQNYYATPLMTLMVQ